MQPITSIVHVPIGVESILFYKQTKYTFYIILVVLKK